MKITLYILFFAAVGMAIFGVISKANDPTTGDLFIGLAVVILFFVWMPTFVYHRWKGKNVQDYMLNKENIEKMRKYTDNNKL
ncbi:hypothetical protein ULMS_06580 [Patiriisocius marinistellae]|uniref:Uncharacterized protein n=1 Tax=Patiriisocius marinistellae TaxID=2494560 RepID=A0A5J4FTU2_9FLAO|nr:hypothetical protein [Patiriisocius marinistellae]GEQ85150.1 hypothetical protein ULMS_06580 [Patiriisocius marinistellae]